MKLPNFRLYDTQATYGMILSVLALLGLLALGIVVFKGINTHQFVIPYNEEVGLSQYRKPLVFAMTPACVLAGLVGGILGFRSLGQSRNTKQGRSWLGMTLGAFVVAMAPVFMGAWLWLSESIITEKPDAAAASAVQP